MVDETGAQNSSQERRLLSRRGSRLRKGVAAAILAIAAGSPFQRAAATERADVSTLGGGRLETLTGVRVPFVENRGQFPDRVAFSAPTLFGTVFVTRDGEIVYALPAGREAPGLGRRRRTPGSAPLTETIVSGRPLPAAGPRAVTRVSYFMGEDRKRWQSGVESYDEVRLGEVWSGVSLALRAHAGNVEKVFTLAPGAWAARIRLEVRGSRSLRVAPDGSLVARRDGGDVHFTAPVAYQERNGSHETIDAAYTVEGARYGFRLGPYDRARPVVIDPLLQSTYLGGNGFDQINAITVHPESGEVLVAGFTASYSFPQRSPSGVQPLHGGGIYDGFVARLDPSLRTLLQATYFGGTADDYVTALAVDTSGEVLIAGHTFSSDLPGTTGGAQPALDPGTAGFTDGFVARLDPTLATLSQATYLGGNSADTINALAVHPTSGEIYVAGATASTNFPGTAGGAQAASGGGLYDGYVARLDPTLTALLQSTYLGGSADDDRVTGLAVHPGSGEVLATGVTLSTNFPGTVGGAQPASHGGSEGFVAKFSGSLSQLERATYLGGRGGDTPSAIAIVPANGEVLVAGTTSSSDFPGTAGGGKAGYGGGSSDGFVARFEPTLAVLSEATYLGGTSADGLLAIAIHPTSGEALVAGFQSVVIKPPTSCRFFCFGGTFQFGLVARFEPSLTKLLQTTQLGAVRSQNRILGIAVRLTAGEVLVAGTTTSAGLPGRVGGAQSSYAGGGDGFVARLTAELGVLAPQSLAADSAASGASDGNGVVEPGEIVIVSPSWRNTGTTSVSPTGTAFAFVGPTVAVYGIPDGSASYGSMAAGATKACSATGDSYVLSVSAAAVRPTHFDARFTETLSTKETNDWTLHIGDSFADVPRSQPFYRKIETLLHSGVTAGCSETRYCPDEPVTRAQMTLFTGRTLAGGGSTIPSSGVVSGSPYSCVAGGVSLFTDVAPTDSECKHVHYLAAQKVTLACSPTELCPSQNVPRDIMAGAIAEALVAPGGDAAIPLAYGPDPSTGRSYSCDAGAPSLHFGDISASDPLCKHIHYLWARGIIAGCSETAYCADSDVTRDQMAKFLVNAFLLKLYGP